MSIRVFIQTLTTILLYFALFYPAIESLKTLCWFIPDIAYHRTHHLSARIPNYNNLIKFYEQYKHLFDSVKRIKLSEIPMLFNTWFWTTTLIAPSVLHNITIAIKHQNKEKLQCQKTSKWNISFRHNYCRIKYLLRPN